MTLYRKISNVTLGVAMGGLLLMASGGPAFAARDYAPACRDRLNSDKARIDRDAHKFGEGSRQVRSDVGKMDSDRDWCKSHHAEWDHSIFDVGIYLHK